MMFLPKPRIGTRACLAATALAAALFGAPAALSASPKPAVSAQRAEAAAVRRIPGHALSAKYEFEDGRWQYAVLVKTGAGALYEVEVSAKSGKVTATEKTSASEEAGEAAADRKAALKSKHHGM